MKFCYHCGHKLDYKYSPPKFCPNCGESLNGDTKPQSSESQASENRGAVRRGGRGSKADEDGFTDADSLPDISKLSASIETYGSENQQTLGSIWGEKAPEKRVRRVKNIDE